MLLSHFAVYSSKKSKFLKKQEASGLLSLLVIKTTLSKIPLLGDSFFWECKNVWNDQQVFVGGIRSSLKCIYGNYST